jgi:NSS family neurotransmitter:Na+ symporter
MGEAVTVTALDTFVALMAGMIIFPACMTYGVDVGKGPSLIFEALPQVFVNMPAGRIWGSVFFLFMCFAALSTVFAVFENIVACLEDLTGKKRSHICIVSAVAMIILSLPCIFGFNILSSVNLFGKLDILSMEDFLVSNVLLPIGSLIFVLFCTRKKGWGYDNYVEEANQGKGMKVKKWMRVYLKYVLPVIMIIFIFVSTFMFLYENGFVTL